jgi:thymidylate synthase
MKQYLELLRDLLENGVAKGDRTGTGKSIANELIWFLSGDTNVSWLNENGVTIWNEWATEDNELGPVYGKQWTAWPTKDGGTINQIDYVIDTLRKNPNSRRILFHGWNPEFLPDESISPQENARQGRMALPPCHLLYQFYVAEGRLSSMLYIRSSDSFLGLPYNIASLALLTHMLAQQCDLVPHEIVVSIGDLHAYSNHMQQIHTQLTRDVRELPKLEIKRRPESIYGYKFEDFELVGYNPHPSIAAPIAV